MKNKNKGQDQFRERYIMFFFYNKTENIHYVDWSIVLTYINFCNSFSWFKFNHVLVVAIIEICSNMKWKLLPTILIQIIHC